ACSQSWRISYLPRNLQNSMTSRFLNSSPSMQGAIHSSDRDVGQFGNQVNTASFLLHPLHRLVLFYLSNPFDVRWDTSCTLSYLSFESVSDNAMPRIQDACTFTMIYSNAICVSIVEPLEPKECILDDECSCQLDRRDPTFDRPPFHVSKLDCANREAFQLSAISRF